MDKDTMIKFRSTMRGKNSKGGDRTQLYLSQEEANTLVETIMKVNGTAGVKLDIHTNLKTAEDGRQFSSSFAFVKAVQQGPAKTTTFVDKKPTTSATSLTEKIKKAKEQIA